jgi:hypothetical protein
MGEAAEAFRPPRPQGGNEIDLENAVADIQPEAETTAAKADVQRKTSEGTTTETATAVVMAPRSATFAAAHEPSPASFPPSVPLKLVKTTTGTRKSVITAGETAVAVTTAVRYGRGWKLRHADADSHANANSDTGWRGRREKTFRKKTSGS